MRSYQERECQVAMRSQVVEPGGPGDQGSKQEELGEGGSLHGWAAPSKVVRMRTSVRRPEGGIVHLYLGVPIAISLVRTINSNVIVCNNDIVLA